MGERRCGERKGRNRREKHRETAFHASPHTEGLEDLRIIDLQLDSRGNRHAPAGAEGAVGHFQAGRRLLALEFRAADEPEHAPDGVCFESGRDDRVRRLVMLDVTLQDRVEDVVRRQRVLVGLVRPQFRD